MNGIRLLSRYYLDTQALTVQDMASIAIPNGDRDQHQVFLSLIREQVRSKIETLTPEEWNAFLKEAWEASEECGLLALIEQLVSERVHKSFLQVFNYFQDRAYQYSLVSCQSAIDG
jgi:hypothetical protein